MKRRKRRLVTRLVLARRLDLSKSSVDRLVQAGVLKLDRPGRGGAPGLFDLEKARRAVNGTSTGSDKVGQLRLVTTKLRASAIAQARLRERWAHDSEWRPSWDKLVARIRAVAQRWAETTAAPFAQAIAGAAHAAFFFGLVQDHVATMLAALARDREVLSTFPGLTPPRPPRAAQPATVALARRALLAAQADLMALRNTMGEASWRPREAVRFAIADAVTKFKAALWRGGFLDQLTPWAGRSVPVVTVATVLREAVREALGHLEPEAFIWEGLAPRRLVGRGITLNARELLAPPVRSSVSAFADRHVIVTAGPRAGMRWRGTFAPYQAAIQDALLEPGVEFCVVMGSSQWGKTMCAINVVLYHILHDPTACLVVEPTVDPMALDFSRTRLGPAIAASPALRERVGRASSRDTDAVLMKRYRGGFIALAGGNSAASLAARSVQVVVLDEVDRYPAELPGEGSTIEVVLKRASAYRPRRRILMLSSPTLRGAPIHAWFLRGNQQRYFVPCPACAFMHPLEWRHVAWDGDDPTTARFVCPQCKAPFGDAERVAILGRGEWRPAAAGEPGIVSFHLWEGYSPLSSLQEIVSGFLRARQAQKEGDRSVMHTWQNTTLGEPVEPDDGEGVEPHVLLLRREAYGPDVEAPSGVCGVTMGVDVQDASLECLVVGWGIGEESWLLDRHVLPGDTSQAEPWRMLDEVLAATYRHVSGARLPILASCIDSGGHRTSLVYDYCHRNAARRVYATIGRDGERPIVSYPSPRRWGHGERQVPLYTIGVDAGKALLLGRLRVTEKGRGYVHIPVADWADDEMAAQLTSERLVTRFHKGVPETAWKKIRARNEMLDAYVLAYAALRLLNPKLEQWAEAIRARAVQPTEASSSAPPAPPRPAAPAPARRVTRSPYIERFYAERGQW